jgi:hypothetical protein
MLSKIGRDCFRIQVAFPTSDGRSSSHRFWLCKQISRAGLGPESDQTPACPDELRVPFRVDYFRVVDNINGGALNFLEAEFWPAWVNFRIAHYSSNRRLPSGVRYSDYITMGWFRFPSA